MSELKVINRELSWIEFNARVLHEPKRFVTHLRQVRQFRGDPIEVPDPIAIRIVKRTDEDFVMHRTFGVRGIGIDIVGALVMSAISPPIRVGSRRQGTAGAPITPSLKAARPTSRVASA